MIFIWSLDLARWMTNSFPLHKSNSSRLIKPQFSLLVESKTQKWCSNRLVSSSPPILNAIVTLYMRRATVALQFNKKWFNLTYFNLSHFSLWTLTSLLSPLILEILNEERKKKKKEWKYHFNKSREKINILLEYSWKSG
jgi:hypothetical protein